MKTKQWKIILLAGTIMVGSSLMISCGGGEQEKNNKSEKTEKTETKKNDEAEMTGYICPMKCEGDKTYDEKGKCPECGMELKPVEEVVE